MAEAFEALVAALARRDLTSAELRRRLAGAGFDAAACAEALERAAAAGYLDDERVALERALRLADRDASDAAIRADLDRRGLPAEIVSGALARVPPERERAERLAAKLGGGARTVRALVRKGYPQDVVEQAVGPHIAEW